MADQGYIKSNPNQYAQLPAPANPSIVYGGQVSTNRKDYAPVDPYAASDYGQLASNYAAFAQQQATQQKTLDSLAYEVNKSLASGAQNKDFQARFFGKNSDPNIARQLQEWGIDPNSKDLGRQISQMTQERTKNSQAAMAQKQQGVDKSLQADQFRQGSQEELKKYENRQIDQNAYNLMRDAAEGKAPSQAQLMLQNESNNLANVARRQANQMFNQNQSMVNSARTYNPGMARAAMFQNATQQADLAGKTMEGQQNLAGQGAAMRAQEMAGARGAYGQYALNQSAANDAAANSVRQNTMGYSQLMQGGDIANKQMELSNVKMNNDLQMAREAQASAANIQSDKSSMDLLQGSVLGKISDEKAKENIQPVGNSGFNSMSNAFGLTSGISSAIEPFSKMSSASNSYGNSNLPQTLPEKKDDGLLGLVGTIASLVSDERAKQNIGHVDSVSDQLSEVEPVTFDYKKGYGPSGGRVGVIAQDLERTPVGKTIVQTKQFKGQNVKTIDPNAAVSALLANASEQAKRIKELENKTGVGAIGSDDRQSLIATGENHPLTGRPILRTPSGDVATEMGITVTDPRLNGGKPTNLPSIWGMQALGDRDAVTAALKSGQKFAAYKSIPAAVKASKEHSAELGRYLDESGKVRRDDISNGPIIPAPDGVSIKTNGSTVLVDDNVPGTQFFSPKKKYQGGQTLSPSDAKNLFNVIGAENKRMDRQPAMQLFEQNPPYVPQDAARYGREMMQYAQALKKRPGGIM